MNKYHLMNKFFLLLAVLGLFGGCRSSKPVSPRFYMIEFNPVFMKVQDEITPLPYNLEIAGIDIHPAFATTQIALREEDHEVGYFVNHQWASRPEQNLERFTLNYMKHNNIFRNTEKKNWNIMPDFRLFVTIYNLEVVRTGKDFHGRLHLEFRLESASGEIVESYFSDNTRLLEKRNLNLFAKAVNNMYFEELNYFSGKIHFALSPAL
jgi:ABC-type uncharacterized transport system auxiliary subunit